MATVDFDTGFWSDADIQKASPAAKLLHVYLWTNPRKNTIGIYEITLKTIVDDTGLSESEIRDALGHFGQNIQYDFKHNIVMVLNHFRRQFMKTGNVSPKMIRAAEKNLLSLPVNHPFIAVFLNYSYYKPLAIPYPYGIHTLHTYLTGEGKGKGLGLQRGAGGENDQVHAAPDPAPAETVTPKAMTCTAQNAWDELCRIYPQPLGIIEGKAEAEPIFAASPALWPVWLKNAGHYAAAKQGCQYVHSLANWLRTAYRDYGEPPKPLGAAGKPPPRDRLRQALADKSIASLPRSISDDPEADALFRSFGLPWQELRKKVDIGEVSI